jgi:3-isopropylmalate dehydratase small subunit
MKKVSLFIGISLALTLTSQAAPAPKRIGIASIVASRFKGIFGTPAYRKVVFIALTNNQVKRIVAPVSPHANSGSLAAR